MALEIDPGIMQAVLAVLTLVFGLLFARFFTGFLGDLLKTNRIKRFLQRWNIQEHEVDFSVMLIRYLLYIITVLLAIAQFTVGMIFIQIFAIVFIVILFLIIVYAMKEFLPNTAAGLYINRNELIREGEEIFVDEFKGKVQRIDLLSTTMITEDKRVVIIPNSIITRRKIIKSASAEKEER